MYDTAVISCFVNTATNNKTLARVCRSVIYHRKEMSKILWKDFIALYNLQEKGGSDKVFGSLEEQGSARYMEQTAGERHPTSPDVDLQDVKQRYDIRA